MFNAAEGKALGFMIRNMLKNSPIAEQTVPDDKLPAELAALQARLAANGEELRRITEPKSGFVAYYVAKKGSTTLTGI